MGFNYAREIKKFKNKWERLRIEYRNAGMSEEAIGKIYEYDYSVFKKNRTYYRRRHSASFFMPDKSSDLVSVTDDSSSYHSRYWWIDDIENPLILSYIKKLPPKDIELITLCIFEGYSQRKAAEIVGLAPSTVCYRLKKIKKIIKNISDFRI